MAITNLTGVTWRANDTLDFNTIPEGDYNIQFTDAVGENFYWLYFYSGMGEMLYCASQDYYWDEQTMAYDSLSTGWTNVKYKTITFNGNGTAVENATLISWLEANGTLETPKAVNKVIDHEGNTLIDLTEDTVDIFSVLSTVTFHTPDGRKTNGAIAFYDGTVTNAPINLTGKTWTGQWPVSPMVGTEGGQTFVFNINFLGDGEAWYEMTKLEFTKDRITAYDNGGTDYDMTSFPGGGASWWNTLTFTGGEDVTNEKLVYWLKANGVLS